MNPPLHMGEFTLRKDTRHATWPGGAVTLSRQECAIMDALHTHSGPMPRDALLERIWGPDQHGSTSRLSTSLRRMKLKLGDAPIVIEFQSSGYVLRPRAEDSQGVPLTDRHIHTEQSCIFMDGTRIALTPPENQLLTHLLRTPNVFVSRAVLIEGIWGAQAHTKGPAFSALLHRVRKKLEPNASDPIHLIGNAQGQLCLRCDVAPVQDVAEDDDTPDDAPFIGRTAPLIRCVDALNNGVRCLTVVGPGGQGKTRLVRHLMQREELAELFPGGMYFCDVAECTTAHALLLRVASTLEISLKTKEDSTELSARLGHALALRPRALIVLDNFEHIVSAAQQTLGVWIKLAHRVQFLVTSRRRLRLNAEHVLPLQALPINDAMTLFLRRVRQLNPTMRLGTTERKRIAPILEAMECNALAILLSAGQLHGTSFALWAEAVEQDNYGAGLLETVIERSWHLLSTSEQDVLLQCTLFRDGFDIEAAEDVLQCEEAWVEDVLEHLLDHSLLLVRQDLRGSRFYLYESVRAFCAQQHPAIDTHSSVMSRYIAYFERRAATLYTHLRHSTDPDTYDHAYAQFKHDEANVWQVFEYTRTHPNKNTGKIAFLLVYSDMFYQRATDLYGCFDAIIDTLQQPLRAELQYTQWFIANFHMDAQLALRIRQEALEDPETPSVYRIRLQNSETREQMYGQRTFPTLIDSVQRQLDAWPHPCPERIYLLEIFAEMRTRMHRVPEAIGLYQEALRQGRGLVSPSFLRLLEGNIGHKLVQVGQLPEGIDILQIGLSQMRQPHGRKLNLPVTCWSLGGAYLAQGDIHGAQVIFDEGYTTACETGQRVRAEGLNATLGLLYCLLDDVPRAQQRFERHPPAPAPTNRLIGFPAFARAVFRVLYGNPMDGNADWQSTATHFEAPWHRFWAQCVALTEKPEDETHRANAIAICSDSGIQIPRTPVNDEDISEYAATIMWIFPLVLEHVAKKKSPTRP